LSADAGTGMQTYRQSVVSSSRETYNAKQISRFSPMAERVLR